MRMNPVTKFTAIALGAIAFLIFCALLEGPNELQAAQDVADDAQTAAYTAAVADGGQAHCAAFGRTPLWTNSGDLVCRLLSNPTVLAQSSAP